ncbi:MAG TPA: transglycosylase domain-containing protein, partial [Candidatus Saccharimonadales bacterium]
MGRNFGGGGGKFPKLNPKKLIRLILIGGIALIGIGGITSIAVVAWVARDLPNPNRIIEREVAQSTKIYDRTGEQLLFDIHGDEQRTLVPLVEIPDDLIHATLTAEDRKFYEHGGISITGIIRSAIRNVTTGSRVSGSTLTQQLVKNAILTSDKTYTRKIREIILSWQIEKNFSKDEILQLYFNEIPYGSVAYGSEAAAQTYFGKSVRDITLPEAAILAALPQSPTRYSPYGSNVDLLIGRQHWILDSMAELGYITEDDAEFAKNQPLEFKERQVSNITAPHFVMYVRELLTEKYGEVVVEQGGLQVVTTLDLFKHELAEEVMQELAEKNLDWEASNAAMVVIDPKTGQILTMLGSRDFFNEEIDGQVNVATRLRQPGSSFKPIVYTAAFRKGFTPDTVLYDVETDFVNYDGNDYSPRNYDLAEHGPVTIRQALQGSLNIPAVKAIYLAGVDNVIDLAEDLGYTSFQNRSRFGLSLVLGGGEVQLLEH